MGLVAKTVKMSAWGVALLVCTTLAAVLPPAAPAAQAQESATLSGRVFVDTDRNGLRDAAEPAMPGVTVEVLNRSGSNAIATAVTDTQGQYEISGLPPERYTIRFTTSEGDPFTATNVGEDDAIDSDVNDEGETSRSLTAGGSAPIDAGVILLPRPLDIETPNLSGLLTSLGDDAETFVPGGGAVSQVVHSFAHDLLFVRNSGTEVRVIDATTGSVISERAATNRFTDISVTPDGEYFFAADYGSEATGYGNALRPHYVHRYEIANQTWTSEIAPNIAWKIEAVSATRVLLQEQDQHVDMTINSYGLGTMIELDRVRADYYGDFEYDPATGYVYHGSTGSSSQEAHLRQLNGDELSIVASTGVYGSGQGGGPTSVLTPDGEHFFYGRLQFARDFLVGAQHSYPRPVIGASNNYVFLDNGAVWFIPTREPVGVLRWAPSAVRATRGSADIWIAHPDNERIFRCVDIERLLSCLPGPVAPGSTVTPDHSAQLSVLGEQGLDFPSRGQVEQMLVRPGGGAQLFVRQATNIRVLNRLTGATISELAPQGSFIDMALTPDGEYLFVLEDDTNDRVHRYEVSTRTWSSAATPESSRQIAALDGSTVFLSSGSFGDLTQNTYFPVGVMVADASNSRSGFGYMHLDAEQGRLYIGPGSYSQGDVSIYRYDNDDPRLIITAELSSSSRDARVAMSADSQRLFVGAAQLEADDPTNEQHVYPSEILAATANYAFAADGTVWFTETNEPVGVLGWAPSAAHAVLGASEVLIAHPDGARIFVCRDQENTGLRCFVDPLFDSPVGDVNCDDNLGGLDAKVITQHLAGLQQPVDNCDSPLESDQILLERADANGDGEVDVLDALLAAQCAVFRENELCPAPAR